MLQFIVFKQDFLGFFAFKIVLKLPTFNFKKGLKMKDSTSVLVSQNI